MRVKTLKVADGVDGITNEIDRLTIRTQNYCLYVNKSSSYYDEGYNRISLNDCEMNHGTKKELNSWWVNGWPNPTTTLELFNTLAYYLKQNKERM